MNTKSTILFALIAISLLSFSSAKNAECAQKLHSLQNNVTNLQYYAQDQDILGVFSTLRLISKEKNYIAEVCQEEVFDFLEERDYSSVQGCQESFATIEDLTYETENDEESLKTVRELGKFYPVFLQSCFYADDYLLMNMPEEVHDEVMEAFKELAQELLDEEDRLMREIIDDMSSFESQKKEAFLPVIN